MLAGRQTGGVWRSQQSQVPHLLQVTARQEQQGGAGVSTRRT